MISGRPTKEWKLTKNKHAKRAKGYSRTLLRCNRAGEEYDENTDQEFETVRAKTSPRLGTI